MNLDDIFSSQDSIALELGRSLNGNMNQYGYTIHHVLLTQVSPNEHVQQSMNEMEASRRMKEAMPHKAEAVRVQCVKEAEAKAERAYLNGVGIARERREVARGMREVVDSLSTFDRDGGVDLISTKGVMDLLLMTQYFDVLTRVNGHANKVQDDANGNDDGIDGSDTSHISSSLMMAHMPETVLQLQKRMRDCFDYSTTDPVKVENILDTA